MNKNVRTWFESQGWKPFRFQQRCWKAYQQGKSGLIHAPTGIGKSYAAWFGPLVEYLNEPQPNGALAKRAPDIRVLWITPLRALAKDTVQALEAPLETICQSWTVELRSGDVSGSVKKRQRDKLPTALVTTPESLSLLLSYPGMQEKMQSLRCIVVDEWHELLGTKRGVQTELCLARLRQWFPKARTWGLSATLGNADEACEVLLGRPPGDDVEMITGLKPKRTIIKTLIPEQIERFPWAGHLGLKMLPQVLRALESRQSTLLFTNTRSQTELWYQAIVEARPDWAGRVALHHGSLDAKQRNFVEQEVRAGRTRCVVCTSSLDLGVDFPPVDQVIQIGSPKGIARLLQRAGRSGHRPGGVSEIACVPTHAFELMEYAAAREAIKRGEIESRQPLENAFDVLAQHLVTLAVGDGFEAEALYDEVRQSFAFRYLRREEWNWLLAFIEHGGESLKAYPQYQRVSRQDGLYKASSKQMERIHRLSVGTITSDQHISVHYAKGGTLGSVEESFLAKLKPGDRFFFAGKSLELIQTRDMKAYVRKAKAGKGVIPRWMGGSMPLSSELARAVRRTLDDMVEGQYKGRELKAIKPIIETQKRLSILPRCDELLAESAQSRDGYHLFIYPFGGRLAHEGIAGLAAYRLTRLRPQSVSVMVTDYGFELLSPTEFNIDEDNLREMLSPQRVDDDVLQCLNATEMAKRQFRSIARVAGLVFQGYPGQRKAVRHVQASSSLLFDVFNRYDPENLLLHQARVEVLHQQLEYQRLRQTLEQLAEKEIRLVEIKRFTPLAFPIWAERVRTHVSSESWSERIKRMAGQLEKQSGKNTLFKKSNEKS